MIWTDNSRSYAATTCTYLGQPCPAAQRMLEKLSAAMAAAEPLTQEDFEISGESRLDGCSRPCMAQFSASHGRVRIYCGVGAQAPRDALDTFADAALSPQACGFPAGSPDARPCALAQALPLAAAAQDWQAAARC